MERESTPEQLSGIDPSLPSPVSRRAFLAGAVACAAVSPTFLRAASYGRAEQAVLHLATRSSQSGRVHTFALTAEGCELLGSTAIDSFAAFAAHPVLPVLYIARDCSQWEDLPRGVIESYAVERGTHPLRLLAQTPMALSATGPRSLAVAPAVDICSFLHPRAGRGTPLPLRVTASLLPSRLPARRRELWRSRGPYRCQRRTD
jgi:hypothetical protein